MLFFTFRKAKCLFKHASLLTHSCSPNCEWDIEFDPTNGRPITFRLESTIFLQKGAVITIPYTTRYLLQGTLKRIVLMESKAHFLCKCSRCTHPTEFESFISAVKCFSCLGYLLPANPISPESPWICQRSEL